MNRIWFLLLFFPSFIFSLESKEESALFKKRGVEVLLTADTLLWRIKKGEIKYSDTLFSKTLGEGVHTGHIRGQRFDWGWGFRLGIGMKLPLVSWELYGNLTRFYAAKIHREIRGFSSLLVDLHPPSKKGKSLFSISYDNVDVIMRSALFASRFLTMRTGVGMKMVWIDQKETFHDRPARRVEGRDLSHFRGIGPQLGIGVKSLLFFGLCFSADLYSSILYGDFDLKHREKTSVRDVDFWGKSALFSPTLEVFIGLGWNIEMRGGCFGLNMGYEAHYFWRHNRRLHFGGKTSNKGSSFQKTFRVARYVEDLTFYGATLRATLEF